MIGAAGSTTLSFTMANFDVIAECHACYAQTKTEQGAVKSKQLQACVDYVAHKYAFKIGQ
jgi:hypothetical protein